MFYGYCAKFMWVGILGSSERREVMLDVNLGLLLRCYD